MVDFNSMRNLAERLIEENGRTLTVTRSDKENDADSAKPWRGTTGAGEISVDVLGVFVEFEKEDFDGTLVRRGDKRVLIAAKSVEDESGNASNIQIEDYDYLFDNNVRWKILAANLIEPGPVRIFYDVQVRQ
jgi:hypothetical protein